MPGKENKEEIRGKWKNENRKMVTVLHPWMTCLNLSRGPDKPGLVQRFFWYIQSSIFHSLEDHPEEEDDTETRLSKWQHRRFKLYRSFCHRLPAQLLASQLISLPEDPICNKTINLLPAFHCYLLNQNERFSETEVVACYNLHSVFGTTEVCGK